MPGVPAIAGGAVKKVVAPADATNPTFVAVEVLPFRSVVEEGALGARVFPERCPALGVRAEGAHGLSFAALTTHDRRHSGSIEPVELVRVGLLLVIGVVAMSAPVDVKAIRAVGADEQTSATVVLAGSRGRTDSVLFDRVRVPGCRVLLLTRMIRRFRVFPVRHCGRGVVKNWMDETRISLGYPRR